MRTIAFCLLSVVCICGTAPARAAGNSAGSTQSGSSSSGDAVGGPTIAVSRAGDVRVIATNVSGGDGRNDHTVSVTPDTVVSTNVQGPTSVRTGDASGSNDAVTLSFVGTASVGATLADLLDAALR